ncbi:MAG: signal peptide peptidase SppA [Syntrophothermus sp.]
METQQYPGYYYPKSSYQSLKRFFTYMGATMVGFFLSLLLIFVLLTGIIAIIVSASTENEVQISSNSILHMKLNGLIVDRSPKNPVFFDLNSMSGKMGMDDIIKDISRAAKDDKIKGIFLDLDDINAGISTVSEIRNALVQFKKSGKFILSYGENYSQSAYYLASVADTIYIHPQGFILFKGINAELTFLKGTLDKLNIDMQIIRHGKFKAATEPLFLDKMSPENRTQLTALISNTWAGLLKDISESRKISVERLNQIADSLKSQDPRDAQAVGLVDKIVFRDQVTSVLKKLTNIPEKKEPRYVTLEKYNRVPSAEPSGRDGKIAVVYAIGNIIGGEGDDATIGSERISKAIRKARLDDNVKAIVLRINSPGGSALAADVIWREVELAKQKKPVIASLGDVAASGGYYIACPASKIIAEPTTITGSIGVFAVIPNMQGLFNKKLGITFDGVKTNANSDYISVTKPLSEYQKMMLQKEIEGIYTAFISKVADGRKMTTAQVDSIGQGRVWSAVDAHKIGLVDDFGGLDKAIEEAAALANIKQYRVTSLPEQKDPFQALIDNFFGDRTSAAIQKELGEDYQVYRYIKEIRAMKGVQARLPFEIKLN